MKIRLFSAQPKGFNGTEALLSPPSASGIRKIRTTSCRSVFSTVIRKVTKTLKKRIFLSQVFGGLVFLALLVSRENWEIKHLLFSESLYIAGVALVAVCVVGRIWSLSYISGSKNKRLITTGPYSMCRNPLYFSNFLGAVGLSMCTECLTVPLLTIAGFALIYPHVMSKEEEKLLRLFGIEFSVYCEQVPRFFPTIRGFAENDSTVISTKSFRNGLRDTCVFVIGIGLIEFIEALHTAHILPVLFKLY